MATGRSRSRRQGLPGRLIGRFAPRFSAPAIGNLVSRSFAPTRHTVVESSRWTTGKYSSRSWSRVFTRLNLPVGAPRVLKVLAGLPKASGEFRLTRGLRSRSGKPRKFVSTRVLLLVERQKRLLSEPQVIDVKDGRVRHLNGRIAAIEARASGFPQRRDDRKGRQSSGGHLGSVSSDRRGILGANASSPRRLDLAAAYSLGRPVRSRR